MLTVIIIMSVGMGTGFALKRFLHKQQEFFNALDTIILYAVWLLLFLLGISVGSNAVVVRNLGTLGLEALFVAILAIAFSIFLSVVVFLTLFKK